MFYRNRYAPGRYLGLDIRKQTIENNANEFSHPAEFVCVDLTGEFNYGQDWDIITSFETTEHVSRTRVPKFLDNIKKHCGENTMVLLSTPCFDEKVGAAANHTYDGNDGFGIRRQELTKEELRELLNERFIIEKVYGTFASQRDYKEHMNEHQKWIFNELKEY